MVGDKSDVQSDQGPNTNQEVPAEATRVQRDALAQYAADISAASLSHSYGGAHLPGMKKEGPRLSGPSTWRE